MSFNNFTFEIGELIHIEQGKRLHETINAIADFDLSDEHKPTSNLTAVVTFMRVEGGIHALIENTQLNMSFTCSRCLSEFSQEIEIPQMETVFFFEPQQDDEADFDSYAVNKKNQTIDLTEFLRREIILHFPMIPVCSKSCKGLCSHCGQDLNKKQCKCYEKREHSNPFAVLKDLHKDT